MKVLICLSVVLALANAGHLAHNRVYINGAYNPGNVLGAEVYSTGLLNSGAVIGNGGIYRTAISAPVTYVEPAVQVIKHHQPAVYQTVSSPIVRASAPIIGHTSINHPSAVVSNQIVSAPIVSRSYGLSYGSTYGIGGINKAYVNGILKQ